MNKPVFLLLTVLILACEQKKEQPQSETQPISNDEWIQLFNGKDLDGWSPKIRGADFGSNFGNTFRVADSMLAVSYDQYDEFNEQFGHIFYKEKFSYYVLDIEYRFTGEQCKGGPGWAIRNSGVMLHCQDPATIGKDQDFPISIEVQFLGGNGKDERTTANLCTPGTNVVMDQKLVTDHCVSSSSETFHGDQWVTVKVLVLGDSLIRHFAGGRKVLEYTQPQIGGGNVSDADPEVKKDGTLLSEGYISLQSESHPVAFRRVAIFDLAPYAGNSENLAMLLEQLGVQ